MTAGRHEYFWKENFAKFTRKTLKQCKTRSSAACDTWNPGTAAWRCLKHWQRQHLQLQGLHPSRVGRRWFSGGQQVGEGSGRRRSWMLARGTVSPGPVATPTPSSHGRYTAGLCQQFQHPVDPLGLGVGVLRPSRSGGEHPDQPMACLTCRLCSKITSRFVAKGLAWR